MDDPVDAQARRDAAIDDLYDEYRDTGKDRKRILESLVKLGVPRHEAAHELAGIDEEYGEQEPGDLDYDDSRLEFADPDGQSALRAEGPGNPRNLPCPTCRRPNMLTPKDVALHYQCDRCAEAAEGYGY